MPEIARPAGSEEMLRLVFDGYRELEAALARVPADGWAAARGADGWSPKEQLGHVTFWESVLLWRADPGRVPEGPRDVPWGDTDGVNARLREWLASQEEAAVRARAAEVHGEVLALVGGIGDAKMDEVPANAIGDDRPWWRVVAGETWTHYPEHVAMLAEAYPPA